MSRRSVKPASGYSILVVDDDEAILQSVRALLQREGHHVLTAQSGADALEVIKNSDLQLILIDYFMPRMSGAQLIEEIRRFDPLVQIVLQTGYAGEKPPREMLAALDIQGYHDKGRGPGDLLMWVDIALKAHGTLRRLEERERLQAELVANVSHEFRTPLNVIGGYTELLAEGEFGPLEPAAVDVLGRVREACQELSDLIGDFLRFARVEAGVEEVGRTWVEVGQLASEMERLGHVLLRDDGAVTIRVESANGPAQVLSDAVKLRTILRNLVTNAAKFTSTGEIVVAFTRGAAGGLAVRVADTGPGIAVDDLEVIFEPFRQLDGSTTRAHGGVGLGLALSRKLAHLLGGSLGVESTPGVGSTFILDLPAAATVEAGDSRSDAVTHVA